MANSRKGAVETILVVDDSEIVRNMVVALLEMANFQVLSAHDASSAIELAGETAGKIDLLLSDVEMPKMSGPDLGQILTQTRPDMQVMLMSGGTDEGLLELNYGWTFIQKPFVHSRLIQMINAVLHLPERHNSIGTRFSPAEVRVAGGPAQRPGV